MNYKLLIQKIVWNVWYKLDKAVIYKVARNDSFGLCKIEFTAYQKEKDDIKGDNIHNIKNSII